MWELCSGLYGYCVVVVFCVGVVNVFVYEWLSSFDVLYVVGIMLDLCRKLVVFCVFFVVVLLIGLMCC